MQARNRQLNQFTTAKFIGLVYYLDLAKSARIVPGNPSLFTHESEVKSSAAARPAPRPAPRSVPTSRSFFFTAAGQVYVTRSRDSHVCNRDSSAGAEGGGEGA